ncbi:hypothetical protein KUTeg_008792 [Tegillarca granosa]|uniref:Uncharacterized protein n=1 Tax=Tegillarca granosa TaxID=220873 RepID=A0ABQ9FDD5_TEGGR|nr:hypothetical protein KUTeg_008792 [Tegillarca granosa]
MAASRLFTKKGRVIAYLPNIQAAVRQVRAFSSYDGRDHQTTVYTTDDDNYGIDGNTIWPDSNLGPLAPIDKRFPLPGSVGPTKQMLVSPFPLLPRQEPVNPEDLFKQLSEERQKTVMDNLETTVNEHESEFLSSPSPSDLLECAAQDCPQILRRDFQELFVDRNIMDGPLTVITMCHKTENDMSTWSMDVEQEREQLLESYFGPHTNSVMFETDERYRKLGFEINDLGCCKQIRPNSFWLLYKHFFLFYTYILPVKCRSPDNT